MEPNGPAWTNMMPKGYQKGARSDPNGAKRRSKKQNKTMFRKNPKMLVRDGFLIAAGDISGEKGVQKSPFGKSRKSRMVPKSNFSVKIDSGTL
jgi:hypothetical protein